MIYFFLYICPVKYTTFFWHTQAFELKVINRLFVEGVFCAFWIVNNFIWGQFVMLLGAVTLWFPPHYNANAAEKVINNRHVNNFSSKNLFFSQKIRMTCLHIYSILGAPNPYQLNQPLMGYRTHFVLIWDYLTFRGHIVINGKEGSDI